MLEYEKNKDKYAIGNKKNFLEAVRQINHALERRNKGRHMVMWK